jgi:hypothetical protein
VNRSVLRTEFVSKRGIVKGDERKLHIEEIRSSLSSLHFIFGLSSQQDNVGGAVGTCRRGERCI